MKEINTETNADRVDKQIEDISDVLPASRPIVCQLV
jgi:hypothetical protein